MRSTEIVLRAFLSRQPQDIQDRLLRFLPPNQRERVEQLPSFAESTKPEIEQGAILDRVHWSWFVPMLRDYSPHEAALFLSCMDQRSAQALSMEIPCKEPKEKLEGIGRKYLRTVLLDSLLGAHNKLLPTAFLPPSPLNRLVSLSKSTFIELIDLLSMHDLAAEIRQIVETKILKRLYSFLTDAQRDCLKTAASKIEPMLLPKMGLDRWDGSEQMLRTTLHRRGLTRLGLALSKQSSSLTWYLCHQLDIGRGSALFKSAKEANPHSAELAIKQVIEILDRL